MLNQPILILVSYAPKYKPSSPWFVTIMIINPDYHIVNLLYIVYACK